MDAMVLDNVISSDQHLYLVDQNKHSCTSRRQRSLYQHHGIQHTKQEMEGHAPKLSQDVPHCSTSQYDPTASKAQLDQHHDAKYPVDSLDSVLTGELANKNQKSLSDKHIVNRIFSNKALGFPITSTLIQCPDKLCAFMTYDLNSKPNPSEYNTADTLFYTPIKRRCPGCETQIADYFNHLGEVIVTETHQTVRQKWAATSFNKALPGSPHDCKPDIMLSTPNVDIHHWCQVDCVAETSALVQPSTKIQKTTIMKAFCMFTEQPTHCYIINIWMVGMKFCVAYFNHSGQVITTFPYTECHTFMHLITGLMFSSD